MKRSLLRTPRRVGVRDAVAEDRHALEARLALSARLLVALTERRALAHCLLLRLREKPLKDWRFLERINSVGERRLLRLSRLFAVVVVLLDERAPRFNVSKVFHSRGVLLRRRRELRRGFLNTLLSVGETELELIDRLHHPRLRCFRSRHFVVVRLLGRVLGIDRGLLLLRSFARDEIQHVDHLVTITTLAVGELCVLFLEVDIRRLLRFRLRLRLQQRARTSLSRRDTVELLDVQL